ncbi:hypothetical protein HKCCE4037_06365 [Rhodobacterales bacterium HKCCE4037]|nr:hypothetical protein [Rhodobacterales bacterium HKCCE4037]
MVKLFNMAAMTTATTGTGTMTLGSAVAGFQSFAAAGAVDSDQLRYRIKDGDNWEVGVGTYTASGTLLSRSPSESNNGGSAISLSGSAEVYAVALAEDIAGGSSTVPLTSGSSQVFSGIPSGVNWLKLLFSSASATSTFDLRAQLGTSGGLIGSGYDGAVGNRAGQSSSSSEILLMENTVSAGSSMSLAVYFERDEDNKWVWSVLSTPNATIPNFGAGRVDLGAPLTQLEVSPSAGNFDAGVAILKWGY